MLSLRFSNPAHPAVLESDRSPAFLFEAGAIATPAGASIARYSGGQWWIGGQGFLVVTCQGPVMCTVPAVEPPRHLGTFNGLRLMDGVLLGDERPLARMQDPRGWVAAGSGEVWAKILPHL